MAFLRSSSKIVMVSVTHEEAKIIIADDHELARESIRKMLESEPHLQVLAEARDGQQGHRALSSTAPRPGAHGCENAEGERL